MKTFTILWILMLPNGDRIFDSAHISAIDFLACEEYAWGYDHPRGEIIRVTCSGR